MPTGDQDYEGWKKDAQVKEGTVVETLEERRRTMHRGGDGPGKT